MTADSDGSFVNIPESTFREPVQRMLDSWDAVDLPPDSTIKKDSINMLVGMLVAADEPHIVQCWQGSMRAG